MADSKMIRLLDIDIKNHRTIAVVGGGGKTSLIFQLARELMELGEKVIITTTTHMAYEPSEPFALHGEPDILMEALASEGKVIAAEMADTAGKICSLSAERLKALTEYGAVLLIEADGAKRMPLKLPEAWEPVIPDFADLVIGVIGLDCMGEPIRNVTFRSAITADFLKKEETDTVTAEDLFQISVSEKGLRKGVQGREFRVYFNKTDVLTEYSQAEGLVERLRARGIKASCGSLKEKKD